MRSIRALSAAAVLCALAASASALAPAPEADVLCGGKFDLAGAYETIGDAFVYDTSDGNMSLTTVSQEMVIARGPAAAGDNAWVLSKSASGTNVALNGARDTQRMARLDSGSRNG